MKTDKTNPNLPTFKTMTNSLYAKPCLSQRTSDKMSISCQNRERTGGSTRVIPRESSQCSCKSNQSNIKKVPYKNQFNYISYKKDTNGMQPKYAN
jgi:hypothetical protein